MTPEQDWTALLARVSDLAVDAFYHARRVAEGHPKDVAGFRAVLMAAQLDAARVLREDLSKFVKERVEAAKGVKR